MSDDATGDQIEEYLRPLIEALSRGSFDSSAERSLITNVLDAAPQHLPVLLRLCKGFPGRATSVVLGQCGGAVARLPELSDSVLPYLADPDEMVAEQAAYALRGANQLPKVQIQLIGAIAREESNVRRAAINSLGPRAEQSVEVRQRLAAASRESDPNVALAALTALYERPVAESIANQRGADDAAPSAAGEMRGEVRHSVTAAITVLDDEIDELLQMDDTSDIEKAFLADLRTHLAQLRDLSERFETGSEIARSISRLEVLKQSFEEFAAGTTLGATIIRNLAVVIVAARELQEALPYPRTATQSRHSMSRRWRARA